MGRGSGYLAVMAGIVCGAEMVLVPEAAVTLQEVSDAIESAYRRGKTHAIIIIAEGANLHITDLAKAIDEMDTGFQTRVTILGHIQRGGSPTAFDRLLAARMGVKAVDSLLGGKSDLMTGLHGRGIELVSLEEVISKKQQASEDYYRMARILAR
jgi:6-phosphofructokinase 1